ncbi:MAG: hypothetical protein ACRC0E_00450 [Soonwooa sp.]
MSTSEIVDLVNERQDRDHVDYYEMLGNVFQFSFNQTHNLDFAKKAKVFYDLYLQKSGIFALRIINRISVLKSSLDN